MDGWICRACWKRNKQKAQHCFMCGTPRDADHTVVQHQRVALQADVAARIPEDEIVPDWVVAVPVAVFLTMAWVQKVLAVLWLALSVLAAVIYPILLPLGVVSAVMYWAIGKAYRGIVGGMRDRAAWAFLVGALLSGGVGAVNLYVLILEPEVMVSAPIVLTVLVGLYVLVNLVAAGCAFTGLVFALVRPRTRPRQAA